MQRKAQVRLTQKPMKRLRQEIHLTTWYTQTEMTLGAKDVLYVEHYLFYDFDGDGIDERIRVCTAGDGVHVLNVEQWDDLPIAMFCPDPEPHTAIGSCPADYLKAYPGRKIPDYARYP